MYTQLPMEPDNDSGKANRITMKLGSTTFPESPMRPLGKQDSKVTTRILRVVTCFEFSYSIVGTSVWLLYR